MTRAVVLLSGGLDSATALAIARDRGHECHALTVDYGQRHARELAAAAAVAQHAGVTQTVLQCDLRQIGGSALTDDLAVPDGVETASEGTPGGEIPGDADAAIPITYVPARNTVLLSLALGFAETRHADAIFIGANAVDYSGYPDCRPEYIDAFNALAALATKRAVEGRPTRIEAPLLRLTKAEIIRRGLALGVDYGLTWSCYRGGETPCGACDSCRLRAKGFAEAGARDPLVEG